MEDLTGKMTGDTVTAAEFIQSKAEWDNIITQTGQTATNADLNQGGKGVAEYVSNGNFYTDSGFANAYLLTSIGTKQSLPRLVDGMAAEFIVGNTNTTSSTVNIATLGAKNIVNTSIGGELTAGLRVLLKYRLGADNYEIVPVPTATFVTDYSSAVKKYVHNDGASSGLFNVTSNITETTFESIGPTGAGATNTWGAMDDIPDGATIATIAIRIVYMASAVDTSGFQKVYARQNGSSAAAGPETTVAELGTTTDDQVGVFSTYVTVDVPLDSDLIFEMTWDESNTASLATDIYLKSFWGP